MTPSAGILARAAIVAERPGGAVFKVMGTANPFILFIFRLMEYAD